jgi:predicted secreted hydrolase
MMRLALVVTAGLLTLAGEWNRARPDYDWSFPRDHWKHDGYRSEWWYFTGHLDASAGGESRRFAYQFTFFRIGVLPERPRLDSEWSSTSFLMGHAALTDLDDGKHVFSEVLYREVPLLGGFLEHPEPRIGWTRGPAGTSARWTLDWNGAGFDFTARDDALGIRLELSTHPVKPLVLQGPNGFSRKGGEEGAASQYYSITRLETSGEVEMSGRAYTVTGTSWMDKEFSSSQLGELQVGWDWFSLQMNDGRDLMLYLMRRADGSVDFARGTVVSPDGAPTYLSRHDFEVEVLQSWHSVQTDARYPSRWRITVRPSNDPFTFEVVSLVPDQENRSRLPGGVHYWEGAVSMLDERGVAMGRGFVELTGYGEGNRPPV